MTATSAISIEAKQRLRDRRAALLRLVGSEIVSASESQAPAAREQRGERDLCESELVQLLSEAHRRDVAQVDAALIRIEEGSYGECERCGRAIGRQRLRAIPDARLCIPCAAP